MSTAKKQSTKKLVKAQSFKIAKTINTPFLSFKITEQTVYWMILMSLIAILFMWVLNIQIDTLRAVSAI